MFELLILKPFFNLLIGLYNILPGQDIGLAIILMTVVVKAVLWPFMTLQIKQQRALQAIQPKIEEIRSRLKDDKEAQGRELMALYAREKVNPASSCLPLLIQIPIFIGLYQALSRGLGAIDGSLLYGFVQNPGVIQTQFLGLVELTRPNVLLAVIAGLIQFVQGRQMLKSTPKAVAQPPKEVADTQGAQDESMAAIMNKQMMYMMPILTIVIGIKLPAGLTLYWLVMSLLSVVQQWWIMRTLPPKMTQQLPG